MKRVYPLALGLSVIAVASCSTSTVTRTVTVPAAPPKSSSPAAQQATSSPSPSPSPSNSPAAVAPPASSAPATPQANQIIARFNGSNDQNTPSFTTPANWHLSWSYWGCGDGPSNFIVTEYNTDGSIDSNGVSVNELGTGRGPVATYAFGDAGTHYFQVVSGCSWSLVPVTG